MRKACVSDHMDPFLFMLRMHFIWRRLFEGPEPSVIGVVRVDQGKQETSGQTTRLDSDDSET